MVLFATEVPFLPNLWPLQAVQEFPNPGFFPNPIYHHLEESQKHLLLLPFLTGTPGRCGADTEGLQPWTEVPWFSGAKMLFITSQFCTVDTTQYITFCVSCTEQWWFMKPVFKCILITMVVPWTALIPLHSTACIEPLQFQFNQTVQRNICQAVRT